MNHQKTQLRATSLNVAIVGTIFFIVFLGVLIHNGYQHYVMGVQDENDLDAQKKALLQTPDDTALIHEIRQKDLQTRSNKLHHLDTAAKGGGMLLVSGLITLFALRGRSELMGIAPVPTPDTKVPKQVRQQGWARRSVIVVVLSLVGLCIYAIQSLPLGFMTSAPTEAPVAEDVAPIDQTNPAPVPVAASMSSYATPEELAQNWHRFRGYAGSGWTSYTDIPTAWDGAEGEGILWKTEVPLSGHNSPIVWEGRIFLSGANEEKREVYCFDTQTGTLTWTGEVPTVSTDEEHDIMEDTGYAASTMATDGVRVYAIFATGDLAAFDFSGQRLWHKNLGFPDNSYGHASSLEVWQDRVIVQYDQGYVDDQKSRLFAFAGATGEIVWEEKRPVDTSWTSPIVAKVGGGQLLTIAAPWVISYDPTTGQEIWRAECVDGEVAASPVVAGDVVLAIEPYAQTVGIRWDGKGNVTETHVLWKNEDIGPEFVSPVSDGTHVILEDGGLLDCLSAKDGHLLWEHELEESSHASPSIVGDKLYVLAENGTMYVGTIGDEDLLDVVENKLGENCFASPAFMPGRIYIRGEKNLYCVGKE